MPMFGFGLIKLKKEGEEYAEYHTVRECFFPWEVNKMTGLNRFLCGTAYNAGLEGQNDCLCPSCWPSLSMKYVVA